MYGGGKMPIKKIKDLITKLATDADYRKKFFESGKKEELLGRDFSKEEREVLVNLTPDKVEEFVASNDRVSFSDIRI
jgi:hypothetical protein